MHLKFCARIYLFFKLPESPEFLSRVKVVNLNIIFKLFLPANRIMFEFIYFCLEVCANVWDMKFTLNHVGKPE